jgi:hypothetical protein
MANLMTLIRLAGILLGAAAICVALVDLDIAHRSSSVDVAPAAAATEASLRWTVHSSNPDRASTLRR